jgi:ComF family protein
MMISNAPVLSGRFSIFEVLPILKDIQTGLLHLFYPRLCEGCSRQLLPAEEVLCIGCTPQLPETRYHDTADNETALRFAGRVPFAHATSFAYFTNDGLLQHLLHGLKYKGKKEIGYYLGQKLAGDLRQTDWASSIDMIIPVPLHKSKKAKRGFNQSMLIAEGMSKILNVPASENHLVRIRDTESQTHKTRTERVNNMAAAFKMAKPGSLTGKHILLCDDVLTTGATLEACALALMDEESIKISIATIGIAVS